MDQQGSNGIVGSHGGPPVAEAEASPSSSSSGGACDGNGANIPATGDSSPSREARKRRYSEDLPAPLLAPLITPPLAGCRTRVGAESGFDIVAVASAFEENSIHAARNQHIHLPGNQTKSNGIVSSNAINRLESSGPNFEARDSVEEHEVKVSVLSPAQQEEDGERRMSTMGKTIKRASVNGFKHINAELEKSIPAGEVTSLSPSAMTKASGSSPSTGNGSSTVSRTGLGAQTGTTSGSGSKSASGTSEAHSSEGRSESGSDADSSSESGSGSGRASDSGSDSGSGSASGSGSGSYSGSSSSHSHSSGSRNRSNENTTGELEQEDETPMSPQGVDTVKRVLSIWSAGHSDHMGNMDEADGRMARPSVRQRNSAWGKIAMTHALARSLAAQDTDTWSTDKQSMSLARRAQIAVRNAVEDLNDLLEPVLMRIPLLGKKKTKPGVLKGILITDKTRYRRKKRRVRFKLALHATKVMVAKDFSLKKLAENKKLLEWWGKIRVMLFTYEFFVWPCRFALGVHAKNMMDPPQSWAINVDIAIDCFFFLDIGYELVSSQVNPASTGPTYKMKDSPKAGRKAKKRAKQQIAKLKQFQEKEAESNVVAYKRRAMLMDMLAIICMYVGLVIAMESNMTWRKDDMKHFGATDNPPPPTDFIFWVSTLPRLVRVQKLAAYFRDQEVAIQVNVRKVAVYKFALIVIGMAHWIGCIFYFSARCYNFDNDPDRKTWVAQFSDRATLTRYIDFKNHEHINMSMVFQRYLVILFKGLNALTNLGYEGGSPSNTWDMIIAISMFFVQIIVQAYILGTLFHYLVKKDANVEAFRKRMQRLDDYSIQRSLPYSLKIRLRQYFEFQYYKKRGDDLKIMRSLPGSIQMKVASFQYSEVLLRNRAMFRNCNGQFLNMMTVRLREVYLMPGEVHLRQGDMSRDMCFVTHGSLECSKDNVLLRTVRADSDGPSVVGEVAFFMGISEPYTTAARLTGDVTLLVFAKTDYEELVENYPEQHDILVTNLLAHFELDKSGADVAIHKQAEEGDDDYLDLKKAIQGALIKKNADALSGMVYAASEGDVDTVKHLLQRGLPINSSDYDLRTTLHLACTEGNIRVVELLVEEGADVNVQDRWGCTPLQDAIAKKHLPIVDFLCSHSARLMYEDAASKLCQAASEGNVDDMKVLLDNGVDPDEGDYDQRTALHLAASEGSLRMADFLITSGANVNVTDRWGNTPLQDAVNNHNELLAKLIRTHGGVLREHDAVGAFCSAAANGDLSMLRLLEENGVDRDAMDYDQRTALHLACTDQQILSVNHLLNVCQADPNICDRWKGTPLDEATAAGSIDAAVLLIGAGGRPGVEADPAALEKLMKDAPFVDVVRKRVNQLAIKVRKGMLYADMLDEEVSAKFNHKCLVQSLERTYSLQGMLKRLHEAVKVIDSSMEKLKDTLMRVLGTQQEERNMRREALERGTHAKAPVEGRSKYDTIGQAMDESDGKATPGLESPSNHKKLRQLNKFMLQLNRVKALLLEFEEMLVLGMYTEEGEVIQLEEQLYQMLYELGMNANTEQVTRILQEVQDPENPNALTLLSIALSSTFRSLVQLCSGSFLSHEDFQDGALNAMMLKEAFDLIDEAFAIFDINQNGLIELSELQEFWDLVKVAGGGTLESLFSEKGPENPDGSLNKIQFTQRYLSLVGLANEESDSEEDSGSDSESDLHSGSDYWSDIDALDEATTLENEEVMARARGQVTEEEKSMEMAEKALTLMKGTIKQDLENDGARGTALVPQRSNWSIVKAKTSMFTTMVMSKVSKTSENQAPSVPGVDPVKERKLMEIFNRVDEDGNGSIDLNELLNMLQNTSENAHVKNSPGQVVKMMDQIDTSRNGMVSSKEFVAAFASLSLDEMSYLLKRMEKSEEGKATDELPSDAPWYILAPSSPYLARWKYVQMFTAIYFFYEVPLHIAFSPEDVYWWWWIMNLIVDIILLMDILSYFVTAYKNKKSVLVYDLSKVRRHYLGTKFPIHFLVAFPTDYIIWATFGFAGLSRPDHTIAWTRVVKLLRLLELHDHAKATASDTAVDTIWGGIKSLSPIIFGMNHVLACVWWYIGTKMNHPDLRSESHWVQHYKGFGCPLEGFLECSSIEERYLVSYYWVFASLTTNGLVGDMTPKNMVEIGFTCIVMLVSLTLYAYVLGEISNLVMKQDEDLVATRSSILQVETFVKQRTLPPDLQKEISHYFQFLASSNAQGEDEEDIFELLSHTLQVDVAKYISRTLLDQVALFHQCNSGFLDSLSVLLRESTILPDTYVFHVNDVSRELYIVNSGAVELTTESYQEGERVEAVLSNGDVFGEVSFLFGMRQTSHARTPPNIAATLFCLQKQDYVQLAKLYPEEEEKVTKNTLYSWETARSGKNQSSGQSSASSGKSSAIDTHALDDMIKVKRVLEVAKQKKRNEKIVALVDAASKNDTKEVARILASGDVEVDEGDYDDRTSLHLAASEGHEEMVVLLLDVYRADVNIVDHFGGTPMIDAVRHKHDNIAQLLRNRGAELKLKDPATQLCSAAAKGDMEQIKRLVENHVNPNLADYDQRTALHLAASNGHLEVVKYLVAQADIELSLEDRTKGTPLQDAINHGHVNVQAYLRERGATVGNMDVAARLCAAAAENDLEELKTLQRNGVDMSTGDYDQRTALHLAASNGQLEACSWLLNQAAVDINPVDRLDGTPYSDAIRHKHKVVALLLEERGALPSGHPSLESRRGKLDEIRAAERAKAEKERMVTIIEKSKETLILNVATDLLGQLDILMASIRANAALFLQLLGELIDFHMRGESMWGAPQVASATQLQKVGEQLVGQLKTMLKLLGVDRGNIKLLTEKSRLVSVLNPNLKVTINSTIQHLGEVETTLTQLMKEGAANDYYFDAINNTKKSKKSKSKGKLGDAAL